MATTEVDIKKLLEAGAHFGHKTSRWNPKMKDYIHSKRNGIHIIDLTKTVQKLNEALEFVTKLSQSSKQILFVGTKLQSQAIIKDLAEKTKMPYVTERWLGGTLTNWNTISGRIKYLKDLESKIASGEIQNKYNKLEVQRVQEEIEEMNRIYGGIKEMNGKPGAVFVVDSTANSIVVREANKLKIPVIGICDSNSDPTKISYPIPANDDAIKTIQLIADYIGQAIEAGKAKSKSK